MRRIGHFPFGKGVSIIFLVLFGPLLLNISALHSAEIDSFGGHPERLSNSLPLLDNEINVRMDRGMKKLNDSKKDCSRPEEGHKLFDEILSELVGQGGFILYGKIERFIEKTEHIEKNDLTFEESIYRDFNLIEAPALHLGRMGVVIRLGRHVVGSDKIGHFFATGFQYYQKAVKEEKGTEAALQYGVSTEHGKFGMRSTGIFSYADLVANFRGLLFWSELISGSNPYFVCKETTWEQVRDFSFVDYLDPGWDERMNCNEYRNAAIAEKVGKRLAELSTDDHPLTCPIDEDICRELGEIYDQTGYSSYLINPLCR